MRVVFLSDTHLGLDTPARPRVDRHRRGEDFFENFERVLAAAVTERADLVLHGGDLFFRSRVPPFIVDRVYARLVRFVEESGIPLGVIAGNHERSALPSSLLLTHPLLHVFHRPSTRVFDVGGAKLAVTGVPFLGRGARFIEEARALEEPLARQSSADARLLLAHEAFEGAVCGPNDFVFRGRSDVVPLPPLPDVLPGVDAVLSGHIHRHQVLWAPREGRRMPVIYAGSVERTSHAEEGEVKGFIVLDMTPVARVGEPRGRIRFVPLPTRPLPPSWRATVDMDA